MNGWKNEAADSAVSSALDSKNDDSWKCSDMSKLGGESIFAKEEAEDAKWPVELAGEFELAAMLMV